MSVKKDLGTVETHVQYWKQLTTTSYMGHNVKKTCTFLLAHGGPGFFNYHTVDLAQWLSSHPYQCVLQESSLTRTLRFKSQIWIFGASGGLLRPHHSQDPQSFQIVSTWRPYHRAYMYMYNKVINKQFGHIMDHNAKICSRSGNITTTKP